MEGWKYDACILRAKSRKHHEIIEESLGVINGVLRYMQQPYVSFSCGKDSSVLAHLVLKVAPAVPLRFVSSGETRLVHDVDKVIEHFRALGADVQEIFIDRVFTEEWKCATWDEQRKAGKHDFFQLSVGGYDGVFMGLRAEESKRRRKSLYTNQSKGLPPFSYKYVSVNMIRCCPLARWTTADVGGYILTHNIPYLSWYDYEGFEGRTTARLTGDAVRQNALVWLKQRNPDAWNRLAGRFPEFRWYV